ncbi:hypothetical protein DACRYDRAFT_104652 [Dacryopinax primogenitus]|uniref:Uncharacterized protein n=1 Tax=Dacryopinax primogenitus (strain DJM 731) TaxID=1858805 RepID=M5GG31_DACPD|nr:uncharacterized protein DACRYDRAFT_104652 [Dacryopinax primogenitus]EJU04778.1 hypothetical protein DACRYDRAFT_104652 [Dacryopinax primogenitus]
MAKHNSCQRQQQQGIWNGTHDLNKKRGFLFWFVQNLFPLLGSFTARPLLPSTIPYPLTPILPSLCLSLLFVASTAYTESITLSRYPVAYKAYQARVGKFSPGHAVMK